MRLQDFESGNSYTARVVSSDRITPPDTEEVREMLIEVDAPGLDYAPGQSIGVIVPGQHAQGHRKHFRLYTVADTPTLGEDGKPQLHLCVKRCDYIDEYSGERYAGIASNYLCDRAPGDAIEINGPFGMPFEVPEDRDADLLLIGMGTGIAPFRALVKHIYRELGGWGGRVRLFHGARSGMEMLYRNEQKNDFTQYYDQETFAAFEAVSPRPHWADPVAIDTALEERAEELRDMLKGSETRAYVAGREDMVPALNRAFENIMGDPERWQRRKAEMVAGGRWVELLY
jgi:ferredoxin--NADP+ reductase